MSMPIIRRREIEAKILKEVFDVVRERHGEAEAEAVIARAVRNASIAQAREFAEAEPGGTSLSSFAELMRFWTAEDALEIRVTERTGTTFAFDVTRCRYAEMYRDMGLGNIGALLSCQRDGTFCEGYDPRIRLTRTQTIMQGASHCDFRYTFDAEAPSARGKADTGETGA